ncbi:hypothetical protein CONPUDRAFT_160748 [Coniophora puteana RWD-64-598 SS2]|uniref:Uncharacterized protein n=1 Tax=Coniophora puteana (strain RWD-64-598) TaxID=741705 RepID=R7SC85_CONPW|nr:uncharacterized protein CONPUDRAFT_160748 [Coniophora puteana RWD-64-598 SS2]EIW73758.1 hypothetical protein CONPUDRAFT_160748 [Coniophora puteana RWD-64-598 SS2]
MVPGGSSVPTPDKLSKIDDDVDCLGRSLTDMRANTKVQYWHQKDYNGWDKKKVGDLTKFGPTPWLENTKGKPIPKANVKACRESMRTLFIKHARKGELASNWRALPFDVVKAVRDAIYEEYPWLALCVNHWKFDILGRHTFPNFKRTKLDNEGNLLVKGPIKRPRGLKASAKLKAEATAEGSPARHPELGAHEEALDECIDANSDSENMDEALHDETAYRLVDEVDGVPAAADMEDIETGNIVTHDLSPGLAMDDEAVGADDADAGSEPIYEPDPELAMDDEEFGPDSTSSRSLSPYEADGLGGTETASPSLEYASVVPQHVEPQGNTILHPPPHPTDTGILQSMASTAGLVSLTRSHARQGAEGTQQALPRMLPTPTITPLAAVARKPSRVSAASTNSVSTAATATKVRPSASAAVASREASQPASAGVAGARRVSRRVSTVVTAPTAPASPQEINQPSLGDISIQKQAPAGSGAGGVDPNAAGSKRANAAPPDNVPTAKKTRKTTTPSMPASTAFRSRAKDALENPSKAKVAKRAAAQKELYAEPVPGAFDELEKVVSPGKENVVPAVSSSSTSVENTSEAVDSVVYRTTGRQKNGKTLMAIRYIASVPSGQNVTEQEVESMYSGLSRVQKSSYANDAKQLVASKTWKTEADVAHGTRF